MRIRLIMELSDDVVMAEVKRGEQVPRQTVSVQEITSLDSGIDPENFKRAFQHMVGGSMMHLFEKLQVAHTKAVEHAVEDYKLAVETAAKQQAEAEAKKKADAEAKKVKQIQGETKGN